MKKHKSVRIFLMEELDRLSSTRGYVMLPDEPFYSLGRNNYFLLRDAVREWNN